MVDSKNKKCRSAKNKTLSGRLVWSAVIPIGLSFLYSYVVLSIFMSLSFFLRLVGNGWGCGECGRACYVFDPRRKRPSGRNRSEVPMSTHIGYTPCYQLGFSLYLNHLISSVFLIVFITPLKLNIYFVRMIFN